MWISVRTQLALIFVFSIMFHGCSVEVTTPETESISVLTTYEGCKTFPAISSSAGSDPHGSNVECITYEYNDEGLLMLTHINSGFNCCPGKITADIVVLGNKISVEEKEQEQDCFCQCLFDVTYEVHELAPGDYTLEINGLYIDDTNEKLRFDVSLTTPNSGTFCVIRTQYPWNAKP